MTEAEARAALRAFVGIGNVEPWIAGRPWKAVPDGWTVAGESQSGLKPNLGQPSARPWRGF